MSTLQHKEAATLALEALHQPEKVRSTAGDGRVVFLCSFLAQVYRSQLGKNVFRSCTSNFVWGYQLSSLCKDNGCHSACLPVVCESFLERVMATIVLACPRYVDDKSFFARFRLSSFLFIIIINMP